MRQITFSFVLVAALLALPSVAGASTVADSRTSAQVAPASITGVGVVRSGGVRVVNVRLRVNRHLDARAQLLRNGRVLASAPRRHLMPGARVVKIRVPARVAAGNARVRVTVTWNGRNYVLVRTVRLPRR